MNDWNRIPMSDADVRLKCLGLALEAAQLGVVANIYQAAEGYRRFVAGEAQVEDPNAGLTFQQRLEALVQEFLRTEQSDGQRMRNDLGEFFGVMSHRYPTPDPRLDLASVFPEVPRANHKGIQA